MTAKGKYNFGRILVALVWLLLGSGTVVLLVAAILKRKNEHCTNINVTITGVQNNFFIDKDDVIKILEKTNAGKLEKKALSTIDLASMENALQKDRWIRRAELFFDNNDVLHVKISEREPIARIFTLSGKSFYLDSSLTRLPLSDKFSARLPVFTSFPTDLIILNKRDSNLLKEIRTLSKFIGQEPFWMAQIEQVDIDPERTFDLIPKVGDQVIHFGNADDYQRKFRKLLTFYKQVEEYADWNKYSAIDLQYKNQLVAIRRGANEIKMDSLRTVQIMKNIIENAQKRANDSTNIQLTQPADDNNVVNQHYAADDTPAEDVKIGNESRETKIESSVIKPETPFHQDLKIKKAEEHVQPMKKILKENITGQETAPAKKIKQVPKAVMPAKSDY